MRISPPSRLLGKVDLLCWRPSPCSVRPQRLAVAQGKQGLQNEPGAREDRPPPRSWLSRAGELEGEPEPQVHPGQPPGRGGVAVALAQREALAAQRFGAEGKLKPATGWLATVAEDGGA